MDKSEILLYVWFAVCAAAVGLLFTFMMIDMQEGRVQYQERYEMCIKADKQWLDGNCLSK